MNSRKYSNATFEEIGHVVNAIVSLAETCCAKGATADCYDNGALALSEKSCDPASPFPKHPGVTKCCIHKGLERKLCLADLKQPPKEFPTYLEPSNEELCTAFNTNPQLFSMKFLYEYSTNYAQAPLLVVMDSTANYLNIIKECCTAKKSTPCFLKQRLQRHRIHLLTVVSNNMCSRLASYGEEKLKFRAAVMYGQKIPSAEFKDIIAIVERGTQVLAKCCGSLTDNCFEKELSTHVQQACKKLSTDIKAAECCKKTAIDAIHCLHSMPAAEAIKLPNLQFPTSDQLCKKGKNQEIEKYMFELTRRNTKLPGVFVDKLHESVKDVVNKCCHSENANSCLEKKKSQINEGIKTYINEGNELCGDYNKYPFTEFTGRLIKALGRRLPKLTPNKVKELAEERATLASTCCIINAPQVYCKDKINKIISCSQEPCLLQ